MKLNEILDTRYSAKAFDTNRKINDEDMETVKNLLQKAASSTNVQPWHFVIATSKEGKELIAKSTAGMYSFNTGKIIDASAVVLFTTKLDLDEEFLNKVLEQEDKDGRFATEQIKEDNKKGRAMFVDFHKNIFKDAFIWSEKQTYLNAGSFLLGVAALGIDAVPMEGFDKKVMDDTLGLTEKGFASSVLIPIGYHTNEDYNLNIPKSRLSKEDLIDII